MENEGQLFPEDICVVSELKGVQAKGQEDGDTDSE
jgi:hypothetical protein